MRINREAVLHVARLAKLELDEAEIQVMIADLGKILDYVSQLAELDTTGVPPTAHVAVESAPLRDDVVRRLLDTEATLSEAPRRSGDSFAVPAFVED